MAKTGNNGYLISQFNRKKRNANEDEQVRICFVPGYSSVAAVRRKLFIHIMQAALERLRAILPGAVQ